MLLFENMLAAVIGHIDESGLEFHQGVQVVVNGVDGFALEWRQDFKRNQGLGSLPYMVNDFHGMGL
jgi:hypothetical protein